MEVLQGTKRKRTYADLHNPGFKDVDHEASSEASFDGAVPDTLHGSIATTPLTPLSPDSTSRYPSDINKIHICKFDGCNKAFNRPAKLEQHLRSHTNTRPFACPYPACAKDFLRDSHLKHHIKSAHSEVRDYACTWDACEKRFLTATRLKRHLAAHEGREKFSCTFEGCGQTFRKHSTLQAHVTKVHEGNKPFVCAFLKDDGKKCNAGFDTASKLKDHEGRLHEIKRHTCSICSIEETSNGMVTIGSHSTTSFSTYSALQEHIAAEHLPTCAECGIECTSQATLKSHIEVRHGGLDVDARRTHICPEPDCNAGFTKKGNLSVHIKTIHSGKRFVCGSAALKPLKGAEDWDGMDACEAPFASKARLIEHIRTVHLGLESKPTGKPKKVKRARRKEVSTVARLTGSGYTEESGRNITCLISDCAYRFLREYDLQVHLQSHHGLVDLEIQALRMEGDSLEDLYTVPSLGGFSSFAGFRDTAADRALDDQFGLHDNEDDTFWLGHNEDVNQTTLEEGNDWIQEEIEMQRLIHDDPDLLDMDMDDSYGEKGKHSDHV